jgi:hypothetical protein
VAWHRLNVLHQLIASWRFYFLVLLVSRSSWNQQQLCCPVAAAAARPSAHRDDTESGRTTAWQHYSVAFTSSLAPAYDRSVYGEAHVHVHVGVSEKKNFFFSRP